MVATGQILGLNPEKGRVWKDYAASALRAGPPKLVGEKLNALRYQITDLLDDLRDERSGSEVRAIAAQLYQPLADLMLLGQGRWSVGGNGFHACFERRSGSWPVSSMMPFDRSRLEMSKSCAT